MRWLCREGLRGERGLRARRGRGLPSVPARHLLERGGTPRLQALPEVRRYRRAPARRAAATGSGAGNGTRCARGLLRTATDRAGGAQPPSLRRGALGCVTRARVPPPGTLRYARECSAARDAECTCADGYRCRGDGCSRCDRACGVGREDTGSGCQTCRYGTFNDQPSGSCKNWTKCSANHVLEPGTAAKDVICKHTSDNPTTLVTTLLTTSPAIPFSITVPGKDLQVDIIRISLTVAGLLCILFLLPSCVCFSIWQKKKLHAAFKKMHTTPEQSIQEDDACSCRFPEEEQGEYQDHGKSTEFRDLLVN